MKKSASHAFDGPDAKQVQTLLQDAGGQVGQQQAALPERVGFGTQDMAIVHLLSGQMLEVMAEMESKQNKKDE